MYIASWEANPARQYCKCLEAKLRKAPSIILWTNLKTQLIYTVKPIVHTNNENDPEVFENAILTGKFLRHLLCFLAWMKNILKAKLFKKTMTSQQSRDSPARVFVDHKSKIAADCCVFEFLWSSVDGKEFDAFSE